MEEYDADVAIIGGGPGGLAAGVALHIADPSLRIKVFERAQALRPAGFTVGVLPNALKAIRALDEGLAAAMCDALDTPDAARNIRNHYNDGRFMMEKGGDAQRERYAKYGGGLFPVAWYDLQCFLAGRLPPGALVTNAAFQDYSEDADSVTATFKDGRTCRARVLLGADGNLSDVRAACLGDGLPKFGNLAIWRAMRTIPDGWPVRAGLLGYNSWPDEKDRVMTHSLADGRLTWNVAVPWPEEDLAVLGNKRYITLGNSEPAPEGRLERCLAALARTPGGWPEHVWDLLRTTPLEAVTEHPLFFREAADCAQYGRGRVSLLGDAAHLTAAAMGQGTSLALEDTLELARAVLEHGPMPEALRQYEAVRAPQAGEVQQASADLVALWGKNKELWITAEARASENFFSRTWRPLRAPAPHPAPAPVRARAALGPRAWLPRSPLAGAVLRPRVAAAALHG